MKRWEFQLNYDFFSYLTIGFCQYSWYVARKDCSRNTYRGVRIIHAEKGEKLLVTPCRNHGCNCKKIENGLLLVQNMHGYIGHIYEGGWSQDCECLHLRLFGVYKNRRFAIRFTKSRIKSTWVLFLFLTIHATVSTEVMNKYCQMFRGFPALSIFSQHVFCKWKTAWSHITLKLHITMQNAIGIEARSKSTNKRYR